MICPDCQASEKPGFTYMTTTKTVRWWLPCPTCGGSQIASCCDGMVGGVDYAILETHKVGEEPREVPVEELGQDLQPEAGASVLRHRRVEASGAQEDGKAA